MHVSEHENNDEESRTAYRWFFLAGAAAIIFAWFLYSADERLSHSNRERALGETIYEMRSAQHSFDSRVTDERLKH